MKKIAFIAALFLPLMLPLLAGAQEGPIPPPHGGGAPPPPRKGAPPRPPDADFFQGQVLRAIDEKVSLLMEQGRSDAAIAELQKVLAMEVPREGPVCEMRAHLVGRLAALYARAGRKVEAVETLRSLLEDVPAGSPAEAAAWLEAGTVYRSLGMPEEALKAFDKAIELSKKLAQKGWRPHGPPPGGPHPGQRDRPPKGGGP